MYNSPTPLIIAIKAIIVQTFGIQVMPKIFLNCRLDDGLVLSRYLEVHCTYNLLSNYSYNPIMSRVTVMMGLISRL